MLCWFLRRKSFDALIALLQRSWVGAVVSYHMKRCVKCCSLLDGVDLRVALEEDISLTELVRGAVRRSGMPSEDLRRRLMEQIAKEGRDT